MPPVEEGAPQAHGGGEEDRRERDPHRRPGYLRQGEAQRREDQAVEVALPHLPEISTQHPRTGDGDGRPHHGRLRAGMAAPVRHAMICCDDKGHPGTGAPPQQPEGGVAAAQGLSVGAAERTVKVRGVVRPAAVDDEQPPGIRQGVQGGAQQPLVVVSRCRDRGDRLGAV